MKPIKNIIDKWPDHHLRNIEIAKLVAEGNTYKKVGEIYNLSRNRIMQIYKSLIGRICEQKFDVSVRHAISNRYYYKHPKALSMIVEYEVFYKNFFNKNN